MDPLQTFALRIRIETLKELRQLGFGHVGGSLSIVEALAALYGSRLRHPRSASSGERDYFVLSKGHAGPALYAALALCGYFPADALKTLNKNGTTLPSHPDRKLTPGVDATTGSLGQGVSVAAGMALGLRKQGRGSRVFCILGDGEINEGQCWEAFMFIRHNKLDNCVLLIDWNKKQLDGKLVDILDPLDLEAKFAAFGFFTQRTDGRSAEAVDAALGRAIEAGIPSVLLLDTVKGQGVPYYETLPGNHHMRFDDEETARLDGIIAGLERDLRGLEAGL